MTESWQDLFSTWKGRMAFLYGKNQMTDCKFILGDLEIRLHKMVLASCSTWFFNLWFISDAIGNDDIIICDVSKDALTSFVYYLYNEEVELNMDIIWDLLKLAKFYGVKSLINFSSSFLKNIKLNDETVYLILEKIENYGLDDVENLCLYNFSQQSDFLFYCLGEMPTNLDVFKKLIKFDDFPEGNEGQTELEIYEAVNKWSKEQCQLKQIEISFENKRLFLENAGVFGKFSDKFSQMTIEEFKSIDNEDSFFTKNERLDIFNKICPELVRKWTYLVKITNSDQILKIENAKNSSICFACEISPDPYDSDSDAPKVLHGFYIFGKTTNSVENVSFFLNNKLNGNSLIEDEIQLQYEGTPKKYKILFKTPITLDTDTEYHMGIKNLSPCERFCGEDYNNDCFPSFSYVGPKLIRALIFEIVDTRRVLTDEEFQNIPTFIINI